MDTNVDDDDEKGRRDKRLQYIAFEDEDESINQKKQHRADYDEYYCIEVSCIIRGNL